MLTLFNFNGTLGEEVVNVFEVDSKSWTVISPTSPLHLSDLNTVAFLILHFLGLVVGNSNSNLIV